MLTAKIELHTYQSKTPLKPKAPVVQPKPKAPVTHRKPKTPAMIYIDNDNAHDFMQRLFEKNIITDHQQSLVQTVRSLAAKGARSMGMRKRLGSHCAKWGMSMDASPDTFESPYHEQRWRTFMTYMHMMIAHNYMQPFLFELIAYGGAPVRADISGRGILIQPFTNKEITHALDMIDYALCKVLNRTRRRVSTNLTDPCKRLEDDTTHKTCPHNAKK